MSAQRYRFYSIRDADGFPSLSGRFVPAAQAFDGKLNVKTPGAEVILLPKLVAKLGGVYVCDPPVDPKHYADMELIP